MVVLAMGSRSSAVFSNRTEPEEHSSKRALFALTVTLPSANEGTQKRTDKISDHIRQNVFFDISSLQTEKHTKVFFAEK